MGAGARQKAARRLSRTPNQHGQGQETPGEPAYNSLFFARCRRGGEDITHARVGWGVVTQYGTPIHDLREPSEVAPNHQDASVR